MTEMSNHDPNQAWTPTTQYIVTFVLFIAGIAFVFLARHLFASLLIAALLASILMPIVRFLRYRIGISHRVSAIVTYGLFIIFVIAIPVLVAPRAIIGVQALTQQVTDLVQTLGEIQQSNFQVFGVDIPVNSIFDSVGLNEPRILLPDNIFGRVSALSSNLIWVLVVLVAIFYMLLDWERMRDWLFLQAPPYRRDDMRRLYGEIKWVWQAYMRGQFILSLVVGIISGLASAAIGLPAAWAIGLMAGIFDVIPSLGPAIAMGIAALVGFYTGSSTLPISNAVFVVIILSTFGAIQTIENIWWRPRILGNSLKIHSGFVFVGVMGAIALSGIFATLIVVPVMGTVGVLWHYLRARLIGVSPWPDDDVEPSSIVSELMVGSAESPTPQPKINPSSSD